MSSSSKDVENKVNKNIDKASSVAQDEVSRLRAELDDLRARAKPKVEEAETFLTTPSAIGFYKGIIHKSSFFVLLPFRFVLDL